MKRNILLVPIIMIFTIVLASCASSGSSGAPDCSSADITCVGLVTDVGKIDDKSFNESSWTAMQQAKEDGLVDHVQYIETTDSKDYGKNVATFADAGYDIVVMSGFNLGEASIEASKTYPDVKFIGVDQPALTFTPEGEETPSNFVGLVFPEDNAGFLVGALAAMMTKTGQIGAVAGTDAIPPVWRYGEGYRAGAAYIDPSVEATIVYHNDVGFDKTFEDPEWGATTAQSMVDKGVDVIFGIGGKTGNGGVNKGAELGIYVIGVDVDQYYALPEAAPRMITSAIKLINEGVYSLIKADVEGSFPGGGDYIAPAGYASYHDMESEVSDETNAKMEEIFNMLDSGELKTNVPPVKPAE